MIESRRADIQGLRGVAVILAVAFHCGVVFRGGFVGVDVFFVISGYVIASVFIREKTRSGTLDLTRFYLRRMRRLWPAQAALLSSVIVLTTFLGPVGTVQRSRGTAVATSLLSSNFYLYRYAGNGYFADSSNAHPLLHTWSLSVEEQFYLVMPFLFLLGYRRARTRGPTSLLSLVAVVSFIVSVAFAQPKLVAGIDRAATLAYYAPFTRAWEFAVGALAALLGWKLAGPWWALMGALAILASAIWTQPGPNLPGFIVVGPVLGAAILLSSTNVLLLGRLLGCRQLVWLGDRSYSWYLFHWPFLVWAKALFPSAGTSAALGAVFASLAPAIVSYRFLEAPFRVTRDPTLRQTAPLAAICLVAPALIAISMRPVDRWFSGTTNGRSFVTANQAHLATVLKCDSFQLPSAKPAKCLVRPDRGPRGRVVLLGDSTAGHLSEAVAAASKKLGYDLLIATKSGCTPILAVIVKSGLPDRRCRDHVRDAIGDVIAMRPSLVVLSASTQGILDCCPIMDPGSGNRSSNDAAKRVLYSAGLKRVVQQFSAANVSVLLVHSVPKFPQWSLRDCAGIRLQLDPKSCGVELKPADVRSFRDQVLNVERLAVAGFPNANTLDLVNDVCGRAGCRAYRDHRWWYRDNAHLTAETSARLAGRFVGAMEEML